MKWRSVPELSTRRLRPARLKCSPSELRILSESLTPPFQVEENCKTKEEVRLKYRYLDLRRPDIQRNLMMKSQVMTLTRQFFAEEGFLEIETPMLGKTNAGGGERLSRSEPYPSGMLLRAAPVTAALQAAFDVLRFPTAISRSPDVSAMRTCAPTDQPEFTQIDMELSFVDVDDVNRRQ